MNDTNKEKKEASVIVAVRNEEHYISKCLDSLINQDFPHEKYEIIVVDGMSDDKTREMVAHYRTKFPRLISTYDNPRKFQASGRNIGIRNAESNIILIFSGHGYADRHYLSTLVNVLKISEEHVAGIGANLFPPNDETFFGKAMAYVQMSFLGGGGTGLKPASENRYVASPGFPAYKKHILERIGLHDEKFQIGEDIELNSRIREAGLKMMVCPDAVAYYYRKHSSFKLLSKRMILYGLWGALVAKKHPGPFWIRLCVPVVMIISLFLLPILLFVNSFLADLVLIGLVLYLVTVLGSSLHLSMNIRNPKYFFFFVPMYMIEHFSIALGFIKGLFSKLPTK